MLAREIKNKGWAKFKQKNSKFELDNLATYIKSLEENLNQEIINNKDLNIDKEIFKSTLRALVKISSESNNFLLQIVKHLIDQDNNYKNYYVSYPYLLFHLPNDHEESGTLHTDTVKESGSSYTCWSAVNNYELEYFPITIIENTNNYFDLYFLKILRRFFNDNKIFNLYYKNFKHISDLKPEKYESYIWDADTVHIGNLNKGNKSHYALTCKISKKPHLTEPSALIKDFILEEDNFKEKEKINYKDLFNLINEINNQILKFYNTYNFNQDSKILIDKLFTIKQKINNKDIIHCIAFAYSLIGYKQKDHKLALLQYFVSVFFLPKYLSSFYNVITISYKIKNFSYLEYLKNNSNFEEIFQKMFKKKYKKYLV
jgi:hypothetical protein